MTMANPLMVPPGFSHWASDFVALEAFDRAGTPTDGVTSFSLCAPPAFSLSGTFQVSDKCCF